MLNAMRFRYLALILTCDSLIKDYEIMNAIWSAILRLFGEYGASKTHLNLIEFNTRRKYATIRCTHTTLEMVRASIASITHIDDRPASIHIRKVSGTLKALQDAKV